MIIWVNGAFGSGKTQTSYELHRRIPQSYIYDPENVGYFIRKNIPKEIKKADFQDYPIWREINYAMLKHINSEYGGVIIVPMTIVNRNYFKEIVGKLRDDNITVKHFVLWASKETLEKRLRKRGERRNSWAASQIDRCLQGLQDDIFHQRIDTNNMTIESVVERIASLSDINLLPDNRNKFKKRLDRVKTQFKQIRI
ncbi:AAA family ATPase [Bacillus sp. JCM 19034]|uniref:AAA family ATPase n=1 Tax=Bacillus sp. JCM 19034 TaxID=1481928 RepID=UPI000785C5EF|nr:AAA family ATPase [Bacillus sp. JCM 19034]